jgi:NAD+ diphosphatase
MTEHRYLLTRRTFEAGVAPPAVVAANELSCYWFAFRRRRLLVREAGAALYVPCLTSLPAAGLEPVRTQYLGLLHGPFPGEPEGSDAPSCRHCFAAELADDADAPPGMAFTDLRRLYGALDEDFFWVAGRAVQIVDWDRDHQFCSRCGAATESEAHERAKVCPRCGFTSYPRLSPAIIVAVTRGDRLLLARAPRHPPGFYSVLAGFVEPGETLEECVQREVKEEVGIDVTDIRYFGSQPWPFPHSLMIAFTCRWASGEIVLEREELEDAGWYRADALPPVPPPISISRRLIEWFKSTHAAGETGSVATA